MVTRAVSAALGGALRTAPWRAVVFGLLLLLMVVDGADATAQRPGGIVGTVRDERGTPLPGAQVLLDGVPSGVTRADGGFRVAGVRAGRHSLRVTRLGYAPFEDGAVDVDSGDVRRDVVLAARPVPLSQVIIAPGVYGGLDAATPSLQVISREDLLTRPQLVEDLFRSLNRLPGVSGSDFSAKLRIRNSAADEVLVTLDGLELVEPYHMKDFDGALTIVDQDAIGSVEVSSGGFGAAHGTRAAGLVQLRTAEVTDGPARTTLGLSLSNMRARSEGTFHQGKGEWLVSARRGYLDLVFKLIDEPDAPNPVYYDVLAKLQRTVGLRHVVAVNALVANDRLTFAVDEGVTNARGSYGNAYLWTTVRSQWTDRLRSTTLVSRSGLRWRRDGQEAEFIGGAPLVRAGFADRRSLTQLGVKQDWAWDVAGGGRFSLLFGGEARREAADYDYAQFQVRRARRGTSIVVLDSTAWRLVRPVDGYRQSGYGALRGAAGRFTYELGARGDRLTWTGRGTVTPRFNVRWDATPQVAVRAAWGAYSQAQGLQDLSVVDGDSAFSRAEVSTQRIIGVEQRAPGGWSWRVEGFDRRIRDPRPRWYSADGELDPFPEGQLDRVRLAPDSSRVQGAEFIVTYDPGGRVRASAWYSRTRGRSTYGGAETSRAYEEPHAGAIDLAFRGLGGWTIGTAWTARSGWPTMPATFALDTIAPRQVSIRRVRPSAIFHGRLAGYQRLDLRVSRRWLTRRGSVSVYGEVFNLLDRANQRGWSYDAFVEGGVLSVRPTAEAFIGRLPTVGVQWVF